MAQRTITTLLDDIDGEAATQTIPFSVDGKSYEIDLNDAHAEEMRQALAKYVQAGRKTTRATRRRTTSSAPSYDSRAVRAWADNRGIKVSPRGRIPQTVLDQYFAAGN